MGWRTQESSAPGAELEPFEPKVVHEDDDDPRVARLIATARDYLQTPNSSHSSLARTALLYAVEAVEAVRPGV